MRQTLTAISMIALLGCYEAPTNPNSNAEAPGSPLAASFEFAPSARPLPQDFLAPLSAPLDGSVDLEDAGMETVDAGTEPVDAGFVGPTGSPCEFIAARATQVELAKSPRLSGDAEWLAIELSGAFLAPDDAYVQIDTDLTAIRSSYPEVSDIHTFPEWTSGIAVAVDPQEGASLDSNGPFPWDCLNSYYGGTPRALWRFSTRTWADVGFAPRMNTDLLLPDYVAVPGVLLAESDGLGGDGNDICVVEENGGRVYLFDRAGGDCPAGCTEHVYSGFRVDSSGVTELGTWDSQDAGTRVPPNWVTNRPECRKHL